MFWAILAAVVVVGFALAWWTSGRAKPRPDKPVDPWSDQMNTEAQAQAFRNRESGNGGGTPY